MSRAVRSAFDMDLTSVANSFAPFGAGFALPVAVLRGAVLQLCRAKLRGQAVLAALGAVLQQSDALHPDDRGEFEIVDEGSVVHQPRGVAGIAEALLHHQGLERQGRGLARLQRACVQPQL